MYFDASSWNLAWGRGWAHEAQEYILKRPCQRSSRDQIALGMPSGNQIWKEEPLARVLGMAGSFGVSQGSNCSSMPYDNHIW